MSINEVKQELSNELLFHVNNINTLKQLILNGADVNYQNGNGWCALFESVNLGNCETVGFLKSIDADINIRDKKGRNALFWAIYHEDVSMVKQLIDLGIDIKDEVYPELPALHYAAYKDNAAILELLLNSGIDVDHECSKKNSTALIYAYLHKKEKAIKFLQENGADMLYTDKFGNSPIQLLKKDKKCLS